MRIVYITEAIIFLVFFSKAIYHEFKNQQHKVELSFLFMLLWTCIIVITFFVHISYVRVTGIGI